MPRWKSIFQRRLAIKEAAAVVVVLACLAGLSYLTSTFIAAKVLEARVEEAVPKVCADIRSQRMVLLNAIESYKAHFGFYPRDNVTNRQPVAVDAVNNPLLYELAGVVYNPATRKFELPHLEAAEADFVKEFFHCGGFTNCARQVSEIKRFLPIDPLPARQLHDDPDVYAVDSRVSYEEFPVEVVWEFNISPWRYVSSSPTNNPGKFDLWIEVKTKNRSVTIGNWKAVD